MTIGETIRKIRRRIKMTQAELGNAAGLSQQRIAQYENGYRVPNDETLQKIASVLFANGRVLYPVDFLEQDDPFFSMENFIAYLKNTDTSETDYSAIVEPFSRLNDRGKAKVISYAYDLADDERYRAD